MIDFPFSYSEVSHNQITQAELELRSKQWQPGGKWRQEKLNRVTLRRTAGVGLVIDSELGLSTKNGVNQQETKKEGKQKRSYQQRVIINSWLIVGKLGGSWGKV